MVSQSHVPIIRPADCNKIPDAFKGQADDSHSYIILTSALSGTQGLYLVKLTSSHCWSGPQILVCQSLSASFWHHLLQWLEEKLQTIILLPGDLLYHETCLCVPQGTRQLCPHPCPASMTRPGCVMPQQLWISFACLIPNFGTMYTKATLHHSAIGKWICAQSMAQR